MANNIESDGSDMAGETNLSEMLEGGLMATQMKLSTASEDERRESIGESSIEKKENKERRGRGRKVSVFTQDSRAKLHEKATFTLLHIDQPAVNRVTFVLAQSEASDQSGRRVSGQEQIHRSHPNTTYQTGPQKEFSAHEVRKIIKETFENTFESNETALSRSALCKNLTEAIKIKTRRMNYDRYRIIVHVYLCSKENITLNVTSRCVWDDKIDNYAEYQYEGKDFYVLGIVYGIYKE